MAIEELPFINSSFREFPLDIQLALADYKLYGEKSYAFQNKKILKRIYEYPEISLLDKKISSEALRHLIKSKKNIKYLKVLDEYFKDVDSFEHAVDGRVLNLFKREEFINLISNIEDIEYILNYDSVKNAVLSLPTAVISLFNIQNFKLFKTIPKKWFESDAYYSIDATSELFRTIIDNPFIGDKIKDSLAIVNLIGKSLSTNKQVKVFNNEELLMPTDTYLANLLLSGKHKEINTLCYLNPEKIGSILRNSTKFKKEYKTLPYDSRGALYGLSNKIVAFNIRMSDWVPSNRSPKIEYVYFDILNNQINMGSQEFPNHTYIDEHYSSEHFNFPLNREYLIGSSITGIRYNYEEYDHSKIVVIAEIFSVKDGIL